MRILILKYLVKFKFLKVMENFDALFNPQVKVTEQAPSEIYKVSAKNGKGGIYKSIVRFIPYVENPAESYVSKQVSWVKNPITKKGMYVDDPRTIGEPSPVSDMFFKLWGTNNEKYKSYAKQYLSTKLQYASIIQIIEDENHPELVGQLKVFIFGKKIFDKIMAEIHPESSIIQPKNPFDPIHGRYFHIICEQQSSFDNFDKSSFLDSNGSTTGMYIPSSDGKSYFPIDDNTDKNAVVSFLKEKSPNLSKYKYTPWNEIQTKHVDETLKIIATSIANGTVGAEAFSTLSQPQGASSSGYSATTIPVIPGANMNVISSQPQQVPQTVTPQVITPQPMVNVPNVQESVQTKPSGNFSAAPVINSTPSNDSGYTSAGIGGDIDDILNNL